MGPCRCEARHCEPAVQWTSPVCPPARRTFGSLPDGAPTSLSQGWLETMTPGATWRAVASRAAPCKGHHKTYPVRGQGCRMCAKGSDKTRTMLSAAMDQDSILAQQMPLCHPVCLWSQEDIHCLLPFITHMFKGRVCKPKDLRGQFKCRWVLRDPPRDLHPLRLLQQP